MIKYSKNLGLDQVLGYMSDEEYPKTPAEICKIHDIPKQTMSYATSRLKKLGCIERIDGQWKILKNEVPNQVKDTSQLNSDINGHAFIWTIEFLEKKIDWAQAIKNHKARKPKTKITFKKICNDRITRIIFRDKKIWLTKKGLTIYESLEFNENSGFTIKRNAVFEMDKTVKALIREFKLTQQQYRFKCSREHYAHVKNMLAMQINDLKLKIYVNRDGKWFWIDDSNGDGHAETNDPGLVNNIKEYHKSQLKTKFSVTPEKILNNFDKASKQIKENAENIGHYAKNMVTHVALMKSIDENLALQTKFFQEMRDFMLSKK